MSNDVDAHFTARSVASFMIANQKDPLNVVNRRAPAQNNSDPVDGAGGGSGGTKEEEVRCDYTLTWALAKPKPPAIPHAGIRTGEIIGWRAWIVLNDYSLCSLTHFLVWEPGVVISGDINEVVGTTFGAPIYGGVYSFKSYEYCRKEFERSLGWADVYVPETILLTNNFQPVEVVGLAVGTVKQWGETVEHRLGYRSQFARPLVIEEVHGRTVDLARLQSKYFGEA